MNSSRMTLMWSARLICSMVVPKRREKEKTPRKGPAAGPHFTRIILRVKVERSVALPIISRRGSCVNERNLSSRRTGLRRTLVGTGQALRDAVLNVVDVRRRGVEFFESLDDVVRYLLVVPQSVKLGCFPR